jgi:hypothetical protein
VVLRRCARRGLNAGEAPDVTAETFIAASSHDPTDVSRDPLRVSVSTHSALAFAQIRAPATVQLSPPVASARARALVCRQVMGPWVV